MLLSTHVATAIAVTYIFDYWMASNYPHYAGNLIARVLVYATAVALQYLLDGVGHTWVKVGSKSVPRRNALHSLPAVLLMGAVAGSAYYAILRLPELIPLYASVMLAHWLEDLVTEGGVYLFSRRVRLPGAFRVRYDSPVANRVAVALSLALAYALADPLSSPSAVAFFGLVAASSALAFLKA